MLCFLEILAAKRFLFCFCFSLRFDVLFSLLLTANNNLFGRVVVVVEGKVVLNCLCNGILSIVI